MERVLGSKVLWMKAPSVKSVMKALRGRIVSTVAEALPEIPAAELPDRNDVQVSDEHSVVNGEPQAGKPAQVIAAAGEDAEDSGGTSPFLSKVCRQLIDRLGAERAVEALITLNYGEQLDPSRYGTITEFNEEDFHEAGRGRFEDKFRGRGAAPLRSRRGLGDRGTMRGSGDRGSVRGAAERGAARGSGERGAMLDSSPGRGGQERSPRRDADAAASLSPQSTRVYIGLGRSHGATARDVASLLMRAAGVPGRLVDDIEVKEFCTFANLPVDAARRACAFTGGKSGDHPVIRPASAPRRN
jgi:ATP-dependent RNA helicase DeaD